MTTFKRSSVRRAMLRIGVVGMIALGAVLSGSAQQTRVPPPPAGYIGGTVESPNGREAGVWVIAETNDLLTKFIKIVVTDDQGRFMLPEMPAATYDVWVRGYGLADSKPIKAKPNADNVALKAVIAGTPQEAAKVYPANYWLSLIQPPAKSEFPGTGPQGNGINVNMKTQAQWIDNMKQGCQFCHQLGSLVTRGLSHMDKLGFKSSIEAWDYRVQTGQRSAEMNTAFNRFGRERALKMFADWTDRIAKGEVPQQPPRPQGIERNVVITLRDWGRDNSFIHDEITTDKRNPSVNAGGQVYAASAGHGSVIVVDPNENSTYEIKIPSNSTEPWRHNPPVILKPSNFWGNTPNWTDPSDPHNVMLDNSGRLWATSATKNRKDPEWCSDARINPYAAYFPLDNSERNLSFMDIKTQKWTLIDTCFSTHHLQFAEDADSTLYFSGGGAVMGWFDTKVFDQTHDEKKAQGWCPTVLDTNGDGKITSPWNDPVGAVGDIQYFGTAGTLINYDPKKDTRLVLGAYTIMPSPADDSVWGASTSFPGAIVRFRKGNNPPETCKTELYRPPDTEAVYGPRGLDVDRNGVVWAAMSGSSQLVSFDVRKCKVFGGPKSLDGKQCPEGWTVYKTEGPTMKGTDVPSDFHYTDWVDQWNTLGLGPNIPIMNGTNSDALLVFQPDKKQWVNLRVPYPLGFFHRGVDGRIDDPNTGWKGRGLWATYGTNFVWHIEGGKGTKSKMVHFQLRPDPLAR